METNSIGNRGGSGRPGTAENLFNQMSSLFQNETTMKVLDNYSRLLRLLEEVRRVLGKGFFVSLQASKLSSID